MQVNTSLMTQSNRHQNMLNATERVDICNPIIPEPLAEFPYPFISLGHVPNTFKLAVFKPLTQSPRCLIIDRPQTNNYVLNIKEVSASRLCSLLQRKGI